MKSQSITKYDFNEIKDPEIMKTFNEYYTQLKKSSKVLELIRKHQTINHNRNVSASSNNQVEPGRVNHDSGLIRDSSRKVIDLKKSPLNEFDVSKIVERNKDILNTIYGSPPY